MGYFLLFYTKSPQSGIYFILTGDLKLDDSLPVVKVKHSSAKTI